MLAVSDVLAGEAERERISDEALREASLRLGEVAVAALA